MFFTSSYLAHFATNQNSDNAIRLSEVLRTFLKKVFKSVQNCAGGAIFSRRRSDTKKIVRLGRKWLKTPVCCANARKCMSVVYKSLCTLRPCKISAHSRNKTGVFEPFFALIDDFLCPTSGGKNCAAGAILNGFEKSFF